jgi:LppP/LprE lipoprotein
MANYVKTTMTRTAGTKKHATLALAATILAAVLAGGCGGGTKTVTVSSAPVATSGRSSSATRPAPTRANSTTSTATAPTTTPSGGTGGAGAAPTRTAPEPAFAQHGGTAGGAEATGEEAAAAVATVKAHGYTAEDVSEYHPNQTLRVLLGTRTGSADGYDRRAFFFLGGKYLGTDSSAPSASLRVVAQSDTEVVLAYALYRPHDPLCCGTGGQATVHFQLNDGQLVPLQPIPPASSASGLSRQ